MLTAAHEQSGLGAQLVVHCEQMRLEGEKRQHTLRDRGCFLSLKFTAHIYTQACQPQPSKLHYSLLTTHPSAAISTLIPSTANSFTPTVTHTTLLPLPRSLHTSIIVASSRLTSVRNAVNLYTTSSPPQPGATWLSAVSMLSKQAWTSEAKGVVGLGALREPLVGMKPGWPERWMRERVGVRGRRAAWWEPEVVKSVPRGVGGEEKVGVEGWWVVWPLVRGFGGWVDLMALVERGG